MFFQCLQKSQGRPYILFPFILARTLSHRYDYLQLLAEKIKSQKDYLLDATQVRTKGTWTGMQASSLKK